MTNVEFIETTLFLLIVEFWVVFSPFLPELVFEIRTLVMVMVISKAVMTVWTRLLRFQC